MSGAAWSWKRIASRIRVPLGFLAAALYLWLARPDWSSLAVGAALAAVGLAIRALASGHVKKNEELTTTGPYACTRNPLYLGSLVIAIGFALAARSGWIVVLVVVLFVAIYLPVIRAEEEFLRSRFPGYEQYARQVPRLLPRLDGLSRLASGFSPALYLQHREYNALIGALLVLAALVIKLVGGPHWGLR